MAGKIHFLPARGGYPASFPSCFCIPSSLLKGDGFWNTYTGDIMTLQERIKKDLAAAIKAKDEVRKNTIRVIMGEFSRSDKKEMADDDVIKILKKLIKSEKEMLASTGNTTDSEFIHIIHEYLPRQASEDEINAWIQEHIDFSEYKNKMQAMKPIMQHFGSTADGNMVKSILQNL